MIGELDVIYVNRLQEERLPADVDPETARSSYLVNADVMRNAKSDAMIMHTLPRVNELSYELDEDPRAAYFEQSANAIPTRMALIASFTGLEELILTQPPARKISVGGQQCGNPNCVTTSENYLQPEIETRAGEEPITSCAHCGVIIS